MINDFAGRAELEANGRLYGDSFLLCRLQFDLAIEALMGCVGARYRRITVSAFVMVNIHPGSVHSVNIRMLQNGLRHISPDRMTPNG